MSGPYYSAKDNPFGSARPFIAYGKAGRYPIASVGRRYLALKVDVDGFIAANLVATPERAPLSAADQLRVKCGLKPKGA